MEGWFEMALIQMSVEEAEKALERAKKDLHIIFAMKAPNGSKKKKMAMIVRQREFIAEVEAFIKKEGNK